MNLGLENKTVIVTASSKGLGKATALEFAREGAAVFISSRNEEELAKAAAEIKDVTGNDQVRYRVCDLTDADSIKEMVAEAGEWKGRIDVLVNNAGGPPAGGFDQFDDEAWQRAFELNLLSVVRVIREVLPYMRRQKQGRIINFTSSSVKQPIDNLILSNTYRAGIVGLAKSLSQELAPYNILVNTIGPGRIATDRLIQLDKSLAEQQGLTYEEFKKNAEATIPMGRSGTPEELAKVVVFLCSQANTYMTGQTLLVDGGMVKAI